MQHSVSVSGPLGPNALGFHKKARPHLQLRKSLVQLLQHAGAVPFYRSGSSTGRYNVIFHFISGMTN